MAHTSRTLLSSTRAQMASATRKRPKHPYDRRNTQLHPYVRHGLGFSTADWQESLTIKKFRNGRRDWEESLTIKKFTNNRRKRPMSHAHAVALMARFQEMLLHGDRTVEGVFAALGVETRWDWLAFCEYALFVLPNNLRCQIHPWSSCARYSLT